MSIPIEYIVWLCLAAFTAGFVDAIVGGGGLIQVPAALVLLDTQPVVKAIASIKLPSFSGTLFAAIQYLKKVKINYSLTVIMCVIAFFSSFAGSELLSVVSNDFMKPVLLIGFIVTATLLRLAYDVIVKKIDPAGAGPVSHVHWPVNWP